MAEFVRCCLQDYWLSIDRYINWSSTASGKNDFYTDYQCRQMYKQHLYTFTHRKNTVNGRIYREDPTIFYWDLINEPRWWAHVLCSPPHHYSPLFLSVSSLSPWHTAVLPLSWSRPGIQSLVHHFDAWKRLTVLVFCAALDVDSHCSSGWRRCLST